MSAPAIVERLRRELTREPGLRLAILFGSRARGTHRPDSDVDVAVVGEVDSLRLAGDLSIALGLEVDVVELKDPPVVLLEEVLRDGYCVIEREPGAFARCYSRSLAMLETDRPAFRRMGTAFVERLARHGILGG